MPEKQFKNNKIIQFPKNRNVEVIQRKRKYKSAVYFLDYLTKMGADYHIVITKADACAFFDKDELTDYVVLSSNLDKSRDVDLFQFGISIYPIKGGEFD